jgi:hypothetical protein
MIQWRTCTTSTMVIRLLLTNANDLADNIHSIASTIITLAEWYHVLAPAGQNTFFKTGIVP